jgi:hypothetical protein
MMGEPKPEFAAPSEARASGLALLMLHLDGEPCALVLSGAI